MKLLGWSGENLFGYEGFSIDCNSLGKTVLLDGINRDFASNSSNGAGKSSLIEALCWTLFGRTLRGVETRDGKDSIIRNDTSVGGLGVVSLGTGSGNVVISRYRRNKRYKNEVKIEIGGRDITGRYSKDSDRAIAKLLGFNWDVFKRAVVIHSWATESFRSLNDRYLKYITEKLVGMPEMDSLGKLISTTISSYDNSLASLNAKLDAIQDQVKDKQKDYDSLIALELQHNEKRTTELHDRQKQIAYEIDQLHQGMIEFLKTLEAIEKEKKLLGAKLAAIEEEKRTLESNGAANYAEHLATFKLNSQLVAKYQDMRDSKTCPECNQLVSKDHIKNLISLHERAFEASKKQLSKTKNLINTYNERCAKLHENAQDIDVKRSDCRHRIYMAEDSLRRNKNRIEQLENEQREIDNELNNPNNPFTELREQAGNQITKLNKDFAELGLLRQKKERTRQYYEFWKKGFGPDGMRAYLLDSVTPDLNKLANLYLDELTDGTVSVELSTVSARKDGTFKDKFSITIDNSIGSRYFAGNSDGEISCLDLAINFAMSDILENRLDGGLGILYIDQAIDLVDPIRGDKAITLLSRRTNEQWCSEVGLKPKDHVFVITHRPEFKDRFESTIFVEKENGICRIT